VHPRAEDYLLGWEDSEDWKDINRQNGQELIPRGLYRLAKGDDSPERVGQSRLFARDFLTIKSTTYLLMRKGHGWIYRFDEGNALSKALTPLTIAYSGTHELHLMHGAIYWQSHNAITRLTLEEGSGPEVLAVNTRPEDMVVEETSITWVDRYRGRLLQLQITAP
jgi:hypothetical protein